ncbi:zinc finger protein 135-like, partial [Cottoperca gobio]|uniref:Zinc finger protein 135-like n=1 Tax=Cottoperca gobio TaxID=56716 RepID=A0A6J2PDW9_COTGO
GDPEPPPHIKEEQEELWSSQEGEQLQGPEEADITKITFTHVPVKSEDDEEKPQSSQLHQRQTEHMETGADGEDCGGPEPARNSDPERHLQPVSEDKTRDSSGPDNNYHWEETKEPQSDLNSFGNEEVPVSDSRSSAGEKPFSCSECGRGFIHKRSMKRHNLSHTGEKPYSCSECGKIFGRKSHLKEHMLTHGGEKPFSCPQCGKLFGRKTRLNRHMLIHTDVKQQLLLVKEEVPPEQQEWSSSLEDPESLPHIKEEQEEFWSSQEGEQLQGLEEADITKITFTHVPVKSEDDEEKPQSSQLHQRQTEQLEIGADGEDCGGPESARDSDPERHLHPDTEDKTGDPSDSENWKETKEPQSGLNSLGNEEVPFSDSRSSAGVKPFSCSVCKKYFTQSGSLQIHMRIHTGEKLFCCSQCGKTFRHYSSFS